MIEMNKQHRNRFIGTEKRLVVARLWVGGGVGGWGEVWGLGGKGEGVKKYKLVVTKYSQRCKVQHRKYSQSHCNNFLWCQVGTRNVRNTLPSM